MNRLIYKLIPVLLSVACVGLPAAARSEVSKEVLARAQRYESQPEIYYCGHGEGATKEEARNAALAEIATQIFSKVQFSSSSSSEESVGNDGKVNLSSNFSSKINISSLPIGLEGMEPPVYLTGGSPYEVVCAIQRVKVERALQLRRDMVDNHCREALDMLDRGKVDDALGLFYRAFAELHTLPDADTYTGVIRGQSRRLQTWIPQQMRETCDALAFNVSGISTLSAEQGDDAGRVVVDLFATYNGKPATSVTVSCDDGTTRSGLITLRDGVGQLMVNSGVSTAEPVDLEVEYRFLDNAFVAGDLQPVIAAFKDNNLLGTSSRRTLNVGPKAKPEKKNVKAFASALRSGVKEGVEAVSRAEVYAEAMADIVSAIKNHNMEAASSRFTPEALAKFKSLLAQGKVSLIGKAEPGSYAFYPMGNRVVCRSIPMRFSFDKGRRIFTEEVNFTFNDKGLVENLAFGLGSVARDDIFSIAGEEWNDYTKMVLVTFLENYRTAFALKDIDFIESVFDDNATIIVGGVKRTLQPTRQGETLAMIGKDVVTTVRKSKEQYIADLKRCFAGNAYVNLRFFNTDVEKMGVGGETYAIQLKQDYTSQHYGDEGYLYLLVDFNEPEAPVIKIRTWQPERLPDLTPNLSKDSPLYGVFSSGMFG